MCLTLTALNVGHNGDLCIWVYLALRCVRWRAMRHLPQSEGMFTASSLALSMHLTAVRSLDKLLDSSNSYWYTVMKNKCWSIRLKVNLRFFMPDWLALWKINGAWFNYAQKPANSQRARWIFLLTSFCECQSFGFWSIHLRNGEIGREKPLICFSNTITFLAASWPVFAKGMVEWGRRPCALLKGNVCVSWGGWVSFLQCPSFPLFVSA